MKIQRRKILDSIKTALSRSRIVSLLGPRQCGKTTLAKQIAQDFPETHYFDLESPVDHRRLQTPMENLSSLGGLIIIDEIQRMPELFPILRVLADRESLPARFLILGSASPDIVKGVSESLAGRVEFIAIRGFSLEEVGESHRNQLIVRGGFPLSFLPTSDEDSQVWRENFITTFLERDLRNLGYDLNPGTLRRFLMMVAHYHVQVVNMSEIGLSLQLTYPVIRRYLELFSGAFILRLLPPWHENIGKRQVKSPKVFYRDTGLLLSQLSVENWEQLTGHPKLGFVWESFCMEEMIAASHERYFYFWNTYAGAELDLLMVKGQTKIGFEFKWSDAPATTKSMHIALNDLGLSRLFVIYPGTERYALTEKIEAISLPACIKMISEE